MSRHGEAVMLDQTHVGTPLPVAAPAFGSARTPSPAWLEVVETFHAAARSTGVVAADALLVLLGVGIAGGDRPTALIAVAGFLAGAWFGHVYRRRITLEAQGVTWYARLLPVPLLAMLAALAASGRQPSEEWLVSGIAVAVALLTARTVAWLTVARARRRELGLRNTLAVGTSDRLRQLHRRLDGYPETGLRTVATVTTDAPNDIERARVTTLLQRGALDQVLISDLSEHELLEEWAASVSDNAVDVDCALVLPPASRPRGNVARIGDLGVVALGRLMPRRPRMWTKRVFDVAIAGFLLLLLAPVFAIVSLAVWLSDRGPVFYRQWRVGLDGRQFRIWKFRSMVPDADALTENLAHANIADGLLFKVPDDPRVTPVGALIRRLSIDELPQFFNVVTGDMSLVGPRPLPVDPDDFNVAARRRHHVRPGITGLWQVEGGHVVDYDDMIKLDLAYIDGWSLRQDIALLVKTVPAVLVRRSAAY